MRKIDLLFLEYGESHQNSTNKFIHWLCVPLIFFSLVGVIASIPASPLKSIFGMYNAFANWATVMLIVVMVYYLSLSFSLAIGMSLFAILCLMLSNFIVKLNLIPLWLVSFLIFVLAWIGQFYGHKIEGKKPSFLKDLQFLLIGPAWLLHFIYKKLSIPY